MMLYVYIRSLTGQIFKILPLKEKAEEGEEVYLQEYIDVLWNDMKGAFGVFPELEQIPEYMNVCSKISFLHDNEFDVRTCKKEVFGALKLLNRLEAELGGESHG